MEWTRGSLLGRGSSATVSTATSTSGHRFAVKSAALSQSESLQKEQHFLSILSNSCIVGYKGCQVTKEDDGEMVYNLFIEFMPGGSVIDLLNRRNGRGLTNVEIRTYTRQIVEGLDYLHSNGIVHCDVKGSNVLIDENGAKIGDLGCAKRVDSAEPISGTPMFMAPEVARGEEQGFPADVWAVGCTVIEMATGGSSPWSDVDDPVSVLYRIGFSNETPEIPNGISDEAKDFLKKCLIRDPKQRWTANELLNHPFIIGGFSDHLKQNNCEKMIGTDSPTSILDQDVWSSIEESFSLSNTTYKRPSSVGSSSSSSHEFYESTFSLRQRIKQLAGMSKVPNWRCEKGENDWITIRW